MKVSIVVPSLNQGIFLNSCLESVLSQRGVDFEILVYDGGSSDGSLDIIQNCSSRLSYWQSQPDGGQATAVRNGFERAKGEILGWVNSDDILLPNAVSRAVDFLSLHPKAVMVFGDSVWIDTQGRVIRPKRELDFYWEIFAYGYCYIPQPSTFFRRHSYDLVGGIDPSFVCAFDYDLWHRLSKIGSVGHLPYFMSAMRDHPGTKTNTLKPVFRGEHDIIRNRYLRCGKGLYIVNHVKQRFRRVLLRLLRGHYRRMTMEEILACGLKP